MPGAAERLHRPLAGRPADQHVVAADELGVAVGLDVAVEHEDRDAGVDRLLDHAGQARRLLRRDQQRVDLLADQVLDVGHLLLGAVLAVGDDQLDLRVLRGLGDDVLVELRPPRLDGGGLAEADHPLLVLRPGEALGQVGGHRQAGDRAAGDLQEVSTSHHALPPSSRDPVPPFRPRRGGRFRARPRGPQAQVRHDLAEVALLDQHRPDDDQPLQHQLKVRVDVVQLQQVRQQPEDQHADERARHPPAPAHQAGAADHHRGDRVELEPGARVGLALAVLRHEEHRRDPGEHPRDRIGRDLGPRDVDAREPRRLLVAADGVDVAPEGGEAQHRAVDQHRGEEEEARHRHDPEDEAPEHVELGHRVRAGVDRQHRVVLPRGQPRHPERRHHHRERDDERLQPPADDDDAVDRPDHQPDARRDQQHPDHAELRRDLRQQEPERQRRAGEPDGDRQDPPAQRVEPRLGPRARPGPGGGMAEPEPRRGGEHDEDGQRQRRHPHRGRRRPALHRQQHGADHRAERHDRPDREVDPAVRITAVMPVAISPVIDTCRSTSSRLP